MLAAMQAALLALALLAADSTHLGTLSGADAARPVLDGHLVLRVPATAADAPGAKRSDDTRLVIDAGEERLEIRASELWSTAGDDFGAAAARVVKGWGGEASDWVVAPFALESGLKAVEVVPAAPDKRPTGAFVRGMFVASPDGTAQYLEARVNAVGAKDFTGADGLATRVLRSAAPGSHVPPLGRATLRLVTLDPRITLFARVPESTASTVQRESDRVVHRIQPVVALGENAPSLTITFAKDARYLHDRLARDAKPSIREGTLLGKKVFWHAWTTREGKQHLEAIVTLGDSERPLSAHVLVLHRGDPDAMKSIAESLLLERRH